MQLLGSLLLSALALLLMPRRAYPWTVALVIPLMVFVLWAVTRPMTIDNDWGPLDAAIFMFAIMLSGGAMLLRGVFAAVWTLKAGDALPPPLDWTPMQASSAAAVTFGVGWAFAPTLSRLIGPAAMIIVGMAGAVAALIYAANRLRRPRNDGRRTSGWVSLAVGLTLLTGITVALSIATNVVRAAERFANDHPYCLLIADGGNDYRLARSVLDLTPLTMRATESGSHAHNHHAQINVAVRGTVVHHHWSYMHGGFDAWSNGSEIESCAPSLHFAVDLPAF
jgi:hypothetical protein